MTETNSDFKIINLADTHAEVEFEGSFLHQPVTWRATIATLDHYQNQMSGGQKLERQFIEIPANQHGSTKLITIGLKVSKITEAILTMTVTMIRQYKKLGEGRHEFG